jgi:hypothetical protein
LDDARLPPHTFDGITEFTMEMRQVNTTDVAQLHALELLPDALIRVQLRGIRRQALQMQALGCAVGQEGPDDLTAVNRRAIPNDDHLAGHLPQQVLEKGHNVAGSSAWSWQWKYSVPSGEMALMAERCSRVHQSRKIGVCPTGA